MSLAFTGYALFRKRLDPIVTYISHLVLTDEWKSHTTTNGVSMG